MAYDFNSDILLDEEDREAALRQFPRVYFALDNPLLREKFAPIDKQANAAKTKSRRWGLLTVVLATIALMIASGGVLYNNYSVMTVRFIAAIGGVFGVISVIIGVFGIMFRKRKFLWLTDRLLTERIRQFHFQSYIAGAEEILKGAKDPGVADAFVGSRTAEFAEFIDDFQVKAEALVHDVVKLDDFGDSTIVRNKGVAPAPAPNDPDLEEYFNAYQILRIDRQLGYCDLILREKEGFWKNAPVRQSKILGLVALVCVFVTLALDASVLIGSILNIGPMKAPAVQVGAIWGAIVALASRTLQEGFQPEREIERMRQYRISLRRMAEKFKTAETPAAKIEVMRDIEKRAYEEMIVFLKGNYEARFIM